MTVRLVRVEKRRAGKLHSVGKLVQNYIRPVSELNSHDDSHWGKFRTRTRNFALKSGDGSGKF